MRHNPKFMDRTANMTEEDLRQKTCQQRHEITLDKLIQELGEARQLAIQVSDPGAAVAATMGMAKLLGFYTDRFEITMVGTANE